MSSAADIRTLVAELARPYPVPSKADEKVAEIDEALKALEAERDMWHERWRRAEAFNVNHRARLHKQIEESFQLPEQRWSSRLLRRFGLQWI